ncbi:hypothetical protein [Pedobacter sandarakinus]|uniref:hypothetical protein n=1 Tax=Pedobacter sandarakinus TaxID=353156 RepID=UPI0022483230|nr:hypothetical protein [Pedobacter sandarakinus]MCX2576368.1 hypothetical protein [Pedobacter sandarakinus]
MKNNENEDKDKKTQGTSKGKASFDQNGKGAADKFGEAGDGKNEGGDDGGKGTTNKNREK